MSIPTTDASTSARVDSLFDVSSHKSGSGCRKRCVAPGSKTSQLLEIVDRSLEGQGGEGHDGEQQQRGLVVANDADTDRAYLLVHQCRRINSPLLVVTTHSGQLFPTIEAANGSPFFDRVLCDVPCSGDGTLRKNPAIWSKWSTDSSVVLHPLQLSIAIRGFQLLKPGGLMVYSTCSMSPYENEAVVAELLRHFKGTIELLDGRQFIPGFKARPGLSSWNVLNDFGVKLKLKRDKRQIKLEARKAAGEDVPKPMNEEDVNENDEGTSQAEDAVQKEGVGTEQDGKKEEEEREEEEEEEKEEVVDPSLGPDLAACIRMGMTYFPTHSSVPLHLQRRFKASLFAPSEDEKQSMHLERCLRCVPHDEDTGGFFVATLRKLPATLSSVEKAEKKKVQHIEAKEEEVSSELPVNLTNDDNEEALADGEQTKSALVPQSSKGKSGGLVEFVSWDAVQFAKLQEFYGFPPSLTVNSFYIRDEGLAAAKSIYYAPSSAQELFSGNPERKLKIVALGVKVFERKDVGSNSEYRLLQEGLPAMLPYISKRKLSVSIQDFCNLLGGGLVSFSTLSSATGKNNYLHCHFV